MAKDRMRRRALGLVATMSIATASVASVAAASSDAAAATRTCPAPALATVPCVVAAQNNTSSPTLTSTPTRLVATTVAPGKYAVVASTVVFNSSGPGEPVPFARCTLDDGGAVLDQTVSYTLDQATTVTLLGAVNLAAPTRLSVSCADPTGFASLSADYTRLQATQLGTLRRPRAGTSKTVSCPKPSFSSIPCGIQVQTSASTAIGASDTQVANLNLGAGSYTMIGRVAFGATSSGSANVRCRSDNGVIGLSDGRAFVVQGKTATLTLGSSFSVGPSQPVEVTCALSSGPQATVDSVRLTIVRVAAVVRATSAAKVRCPVKRSTVPCAITAQGGGALTSTHSVYAEAHVAAGNYAVSAAVSVESDDPAGGLHFVDCALVSGAGEFGGAFEVVVGQGGTLFMLDTHMTTAADLTVSCADDSGSGQLTVTSAEITATRVGTLFSAGH
jgi:hypothetical protein